jgi:hypothetical protein
MLLLGGDYTQTSEENLKLFSSNEHFGGTSVGTIAKVCVKNKTKG